MEHNYNNVFELEMQKCLWRKMSMRKFIDPEIKKNKLFLASIGIEIFILLFLIIHIFLPINKFILDANDMFVFNENGIEQIEYTGELVFTDEVEKINIGVEGLELYSGAYDVTINYEVGPDIEHRYDDNIAEIKLYSEYLPTYIKMNSIKLNTQEDAKASMWIQDFTKAKDFLIQGYYNGEGTLTIKNIEIVENVIYRFTRILIFCFLAILWNSVIVFFCTKHMPLKQKYIILALIGIIAFTSILFLFDGVYWGDDIEFHLNRIAKLSEEIKNLNFPARIYTDMLNGYGYLSPVFYSDLFLYIPAILHLLCVPLHISYSVYAIIINVATCLISYYVFSKMTKSPKLGILGSFLYTNSAYRICNLFFRSAVGEYTAFTFLPLIVYGVWNLYKAKDEEQISIKKYLPLVLGITGIIQSHIITFMMTVFSLSVFFVINFKKIFRKNTILALIKSALLTVLVNLWFIYPLIVSYMDLEIYVKLSYNNMMEKYGIGVAQLLGMNFNLINFNEGGFWAMPITIGIPFTIAIIVFLICILHKTENKRNLKNNNTYIYCYIFFIISMIFMLISTVHFPWDSINKANYEIGKLLWIVQFPWRYIGFATLTLSFFTVYLVKLVRIIFNRTIAQKIALLTVSSCIIFGAIYLSNAIKNTDKPVYGGYELNNMEIGAAEYVLYEGFTPNLYSPKVKVSDSIEIYEISNEDKYYISCKNSSENLGFIDIPKLNYDNYQAKVLETNERLTIESGEEKTVMVIVPPDFEGKIMIEYVPPISWKFAEIISLFSIIILIDYCTSSKKKVKEQ